MFTEPGPAAILPRPGEVRGGTGIENEGSPGRTGERFAINYQSRQFSRFLSLGRAAYQNHGGLTKVMVSVVEVSLGEVGFGAWGMCGKFIRFRV